MSYRKGRQTELRPALDSMLRRLDRGSGGGYTAARVRSAWQRLADGMTLSHTTGAHVRDKTLIVYVDSSAWAMQLSAMAEQYRVALNEEIGQNLISDVRFTVSRKVAEEHKLRGAEHETEQFYAADSEPSVPLSPTEFAQIEASVAEIPDEELREAVLRATVKDIEWKKGLSARNAPQKRREGS